VRLPRQLWRSSRVGVDWPEQVELCWDREISVLLGQCELNFFFNICSLQDETVVVGYFGRSSSTGAVVV
jgi:hypothetical protein